MTGLLVALASELLREVDPDVVITFGPDGFSGHPDHVAVGAAVTGACYEMRSTRPVRLFHCHLPRSRMLLRDRLAEWVVELTTRFKGTQDFVRALTVFSSEASALGYAADFVRWTGSRPAPTCSNRASRRRPCTSSCPGRWRSGGGRRGRMVVVDRSGSEEFIGEEGIATGQPRNAHVVAVDDVTCLTFLASPDSFDGRGDQAQRPAHEVAALGGPDRPEGEHLHRRVRLRRPQDPGHGRAPLAVPDRPRDVPRTHPARDVRCRVLHPVLPERSLDASLLDG